MNRITGELRWSTVVDLGSELGGFQWGSSLATDKHGVMTWIGASANAVDKPVVFPDGSVYNVSSIVGVNPLDGTIKWRTALPPLTHAFGAVSSTNDVAFAPAFESGIMTAYSVRDGKPL